jgi:hypothetical protein
MKKQNTHIQESLKHIYIFNKRIFDLQIIKNRGGWFKLFNIFGLSWKPIDEGLTFSERNGYKKYVKFNGYYFNKIEIN